MFRLHLALAILSHLSIMSPLPATLPEIPLQLRKTLPAIPDDAASTEEASGESLLLPPLEMVDMKSTENSLFFTVLKHGELVDRYSVAARTANCSGCTVTRSVRDANQTRVDFEVGELLPGRLYEVTVVAIRGNVTSAPLNFSIHTVPSAPDSIAPVSLLADAVKLRWTLPSNSSYDQFEVEVSGNHTFYVEETAFVLPLPFTPGARVKGSVRTVKGKLRSKSTQFSVFTKPLPPVNLMVTPDFVRALFCVSAHLNAERSLYDNCHLRYYSLNDWKASRSLADLTVRPIDSAAGKRCLWYLPLVPGRRYNFTAWTSRADESFSDQLDREVLITPAFDLKRFGVSAVASENALQLAWNQTAVSTMWARLLGPNGSLRASLFVPHPANRTLPVYHSSGVKGLYGDVLHFQNLVSGTCYSVVVGSSVDGVESAQNERIYKRTSPASLQFSLFNATSTRARFVSRLEANVTVGSGCELRARLRDPRGEAGERVEAVSIVTTAQQSVLFDLTALRPYTVYELSLEEVCGYTVELCPQERRKLLKHFSFETAEAAPGQVALITPTIVSPYGVNVVWKPPEEPNGQLTSYKLTVYPSPTARVPIAEPPWTLVLPVSTTNCSVANLTGGGRYAFDVVAVNKAGEGAHLDSLPSVVTYVWSPPKPKDVPCVVAGSQRQDEFMVRFNMSVLSTKHGLLEHYAFVVSEGEEPLRTNLTLSWHDVQSFEVWPPYIAILKPLPPVKQFNSAPVTEVLGVDTHCARLSAAEVVTARGNPFCNGPLRPGRKFRVKVRLFTSSDLFTDSDYSDVVLTAHANEIASGSLLAVILALMVFLIVAMIGMVVVRTRGIDLHAEWCRLRSKMSSPKGGIVRSFVRSRKAFKSRIAKGSSSSKPSKLPSKGVAVVQSPYCRPSSNGSSRPVGKVDFAKHMMLMSADSDFLFSEEFELLKPVGRTLSMAAADLPCNRIKNRFTNILPYDYSRVKLSPVDDDEGSDYINANYISGYNNPREYIATQGPMPSTRDDFWRMVWEQQCVAIVNLTRCVEKGREKCDQYWPLDAKTMLYGDVEVVVLNESRLPYWTIREFLLQKGGGIQRRVKNFHFTAWPDFGVPDQPKVVIDFVRLFRAQVNSVAHKPVVVHCSAGVGRSGTFIALDQLLQSVRSADIIDVFGTVYQMRKERVWMVQSEQQYVFIHHCLLAAIEESEERRQTLPYGLVMQPVGKNEVHQNPAFDDDNDYNDEGIAESGV
uniref:protein-tyrosine-phosphatase n=1 Tax=Trichuris muris TaxID=70415 RepID=A0A5S6QYN0_TRIMR